MTDTNQTNTDENGETVGYWASKLQEIDRDVFSQPWYVRQSRRAAFLIGLYMQQVAYKSSRSFDTTRPVKELQFILKKPVNKDKIRDILLLCEKEMQKIEASTKRNDPAFGKRQLQRLRQAIHELARSIDMEKSGENELISFFDGYQHYLGSVDSSPQGESNDA